MNDDLISRVALATLKLGYRLKPHLVSSLAAHARMALPKNATDADLDNWLRQTRREYAGYYDNAAGLSAEQKLDLANENSAKRELSSRPADVELTEEDKKKLARLTTPELRNDFINVRRAGMIDAQKKKKGAA